MFMYIHLHVYICIFREPFTNTYTYRYTCIYLYVYVYTYTQNTYFQRALHQYALAYVALDRGTILDPVDSTDVVALRVILNPCNPEFFFPVFFQGWSFSYYFL